ncbi:hypothetical protein K1T71_014340 [Dendrolimus kikuchii]|uniref:Uncharacterized protein n=1 Tax=Dendrolimus kikuchii TaxID=765133 RepID=A0ACC1CE57_9NEOP|nr:hypothetical protein K1T71_014340 [Dendrolimus kikuchii]
MTSTKNLHPNVDEPKNSGLLYKSASCPAMIPNAVEESDMIPPLTQSHSAVFPSQHQQTPKFYQNEISQLQAFMTPQFCSYFFPMRMISYETDIQTSTKEDFSTAQNAATAMRQICNVCGCPIPRKCSLPQPCNQPPKCLQYMPGYYYYPYGNWFCDPYHVKGACMPGGPWQPASSCSPKPPSSCGPCGTSPPISCTTCKPCMCTACCFIPELPRNKTKNSLTRPFKSCGPCSTSNPFVFSGPCYKPCYGSYFPRSLCSPCRPRKPFGVCGPCGPWGPCRPCIPNRTYGPCACWLPWSCGPCTPPTPSKPHGPSGPCCCSPCGPCGCVTCGIAPWFGSCINCSITSFPVKGPISVGANGPVASEGPNEFCTKSCLVPDISVVQHNFKPTRRCPICSTAKAVPLENIPECPENVTPRPLPSTTLSRLSQTHTINPNLIRNYPFNKPKPILYKRTMPVTNNVFAYFFSTNASIPKHSFCMLPERKYQD